MRDNPELLCHRKRKEDITTLETSEISSSLPAPTEEAQIHGLDSSEDHHQHETCSSLTKEGTCAKIISHICITALHLLTGSP